MCFFILYLSAIDYESIVLALSINYSLVIFVSIKMILDNESFIA